MERRIKIALLALCAVALTGCGYKHGEVSTNNCLNNADDIMDKIEAEL